MKKLFVLLALVFVAVEPLRAVILFGSGDPTYNTTAPEFSDGTDGGWGYVGQWGPFTGVPIASNYFITAKHVGGNIGQSFLFMGTNYTATASFADPLSDFQIWQVASPFPVFAPLFTTTNEVGQRFVCIGRGTQRGDPVYVDGDRIFDLKSLGLNKKEFLKLYPAASFQGQTATVPGPWHVGWSFGPSDNVQRWGMNTCQGVYDIYYAGPTIFAQFSSNSQVECTLSGGDSAGPCFIQVDGTWRLAALNYGIDSDGAYFDHFGVIWWSGFYSTRISIRIAWIQSVISQ